MLTQQRTQAQIRAELIVARNRVKALERELQQDPKTRRIRTDIISDLISVRSRIILLKEELRRLKAT